MKISRNLVFVTILIVIVILIDQIVKFYVKTTYPIGGGFEIFGLSWAQIKFTENYGMAFGMEFGGKTGKILLGVFRIVAGAALLYYTYTSAMAKRSRAFVVSLALITAGAIGNIIDGLFYGVIFSESTNNTVAEFMPSEGGYSSFFDGHVVDMMYFPIIETWWPEWVPVVGGQLFEFNKYIFNLADLAITMGVIGIIILGFFGKKKNNPLHEKADKVTA